MRICKKRRAMISTRVSQNLMRLRFVSCDRPDDVAWFDMSSTERWKQSFVAPWYFILNTLSFILIIVFTASVALPTVKTIHDIREMFANQLFPEDDENPPFSDVADIRDFFDDFKESVARFNNDSFMDFRFTDPEVPYNYELLWWNGTTVIAPEVEIGRELFTHLQSVTIVTDFVTYFDRTDTDGCTRWRIIVGVARVRGNLCFKSRPSFERLFCPNSDVPGIVTRPELVRTGRRGKTIYLPEKNIYVGLYSPCVWFGAFLIAISVLSIFPILTDVRFRFRVHLMRIASSAEYFDMGSITQFHVTIGFWVPVFLVGSILNIVTGAIIVGEGQKMTQYMSSHAFYWFACTAFLSIFSYFRWVRRFPSIYRIIQIVRLAMVSIISIILAVMPIVVALIFVSVFLFGFVSKFTKSYVELFEAILSLTFGDMIADVYEFYSDGSALYNVLAFFWVSIMTAVGMWLVFTTFTATMTYIHRSQIASID